jgi:hypothetical protein
LQITSEEKGWREPRLREEGAPLIATKSHQQYGQRRALGRKNNRSVWMDGRNWRVDPVVVGDKGGAQEGAGHEAQEEAYDSIVPNKSLYVM